MDDHQSVSDSTPGIAEILVTPAVIEALTPHSIPLVPPGAPRSRSGKERFREMAAYEREALKLFEELKAQRGLSVPPDAHCSLKVVMRPKGKPGGSNVLKALIGTILSPTSVHKTQQECRDEVLDRFPGHSLSKDWTKPLPVWAIEHVKTRVQGSPAPINAVKIRKGASLRCLHNEVKRLVRSARSSSKTFTVQVTFTPDAVVFNGLAFKVTESKSGGHTYKYARVNIQSLAEAM